jgi:hypothetical protein
VSASQAQSAALAVAAVVVYGSGVWLTVRRRPYSPLLMNVHKLVDLGAVVLIGVMVYQSHRLASLTMSESVLIAAVTVVVITTFVTGGIVSALAEAPRWVLWSHRIVPFLSGALAVATVYIVLTR